MGTTHYNLTQPLSTDRFNLHVWNSNLEQIDQRMYLNQTTTFDGATELAAGSVGNVPAPQTSDKDKFLKGDGTWAEVQGGGGGSSITITPTLSSGTKIADYSIDGVSGSLYAPSGGGGGSYTETVLNSGTHSGDVYTLSDNISNYDMLEIEWIYSGSYYGTSITSVESFKTNATGILVKNTNNIVFVMQYTSETTMTRTNSYGSLEIRQIKGLKFGGGGCSHTYSTTEQIVGTWIDGSDIYERTVVVSSAISQGNYATIISGENVDLLGINSDGCFLTRSNGERWSIFGGYSGSGLLIYQETNGDIKLYNNSGVDFTNATITVTYLK